MYYIEEDTVSMKVYSIFFPTKVYFWPVEFGVIFILSIYVFKYFSFGPSHFIQFYDNITIVTR